MHEKWQNMRKLNVAHCWCCFNVTGLDEVALHLNGSEVNFQIVGGGDNCRKGWENTVKMCVRAGATRWWSVDFSMGQKRHISMFGTLCAVITWPRSHKPHHCAVTWGCSGTRCSLIAFFAVWHIGHIVIIVWHVNVSARSSASAVSS